MLRLSLLAITLLASCSSSPNRGGSGRLLVELETERYGRVIRHSQDLTVPLVRGDGVAEFFVQVQIGTSRGWWQVDTGAAFCVVTSLIARHEGFRPTTSGQILTAAGEVDSELGTLPSVRIGGLEIREVSALVLDDNYANDFTIGGKRGHVIGILGADLLDFLGASIDLRANVLRFRPN